MRPFRNNNKRSRYRSNGERNFKRNGENQSFTNSVSFQRKSPGRNNQNAPKLNEKYTDLAREALSNGDKILSENYFQHADHFTRILSEREIQKKITHAEKENLENKNEVGNKEVTSSNKSDDDKVEKIQTDIT